MAVLAAALVTGSLSCTELDSALDSCANISGCLESQLVRNLEPDAGTPPLWEQDAQRWGCLNPATPPAPVAPSAQPIVNLSATVLDYATLTELPGLSLKFCLSMDPDCTTAQQATPVPGMGPLMNLQIRTGLEGYLRQEAPMHVTQDYFLLAPMLVDDASQAGPTSVFTLVSQASIAGFINDLGTRVDPTLGIIGVFIVDCNGKRVEGAQLTLPELATRPELRTAQAWAINNHLPVLGVATDGDGSAGFVNVQTGTVQVEAKLNGQTFGRTRLRVLGNRLTAGTLRPWYQSGK